MQPVVNALFYSKDDEEKKQRIIELTKEGSELSYWLKKFETRLEENEKRGNKNGLFVGDTISIADLKVYTGFAFALEMAPDTIGKLINSFKKLAAFFVKIESHEKIKECEQQFKKDLAEFNDNGTKNFLRAGKFVPGSFV